MDHEANGAEDLQRLQCTTTALSAALGSMLLKSNYQNSYEIIFIYTL